MRELVHLAREHARRTVAHRAHARAKTRARLVLRHGLAEGIRRGQAAAAVRQAGVALVGAGHRNGARAERVAGASDAGRRRGLRARGATGRARTRRARTTAAAQRGRGRAAGAVMGRAKKTDGPGKVTAAPAPCQSVTAFGRVARCGAGAARERAMSEEFDPNASPHSREPREARPLRRDHAGAENGTVFDPRSGARSRSLNGRTAAAAWASMLACSAVSLDGRLR